MQIRYAGRQRRRLVYRKPDWRRSPDTGYHCAPLKLAPLPADIAFLGVCKMKPALLFAVSIGAAATLAAPCARADCFDAAASYQHVNSYILRAIAWQESHNHPEAIHKNDNGSTDYGLMQINSIHLSTLSGYGISSGTLMQPCANVYVAAWHLKRMMLKYGNTWEAVGAYHSETPSLRDRYAAQIIAILRKWKLVADR